MDKITSITKAKPLTIARIENAQAQLRWEIDIIEQAFEESPHALDDIMLKEQAVRLFTICFALNMLKTLTGPMGRTQD